MASGANLDCSPTVSVELDAPAAGTSDHVARFSMGSSTERARTRNSSPPKLFTTLSMAALPNDHQVQHPMLIPQAGSPVTLPCRTVALAISATLLI